MDNFLRNILLFAVIGFVGIKSIGMMQKVEHREDAVTTRYVSIEHVKYEIEKLHKFSIAINQYYNQLGMQMPEADGNGRIPQESLVKSGFLTATDLEERFGYERNDEWGFFRCTCDNESAPLRPDKNGKYICAVPVYKNSSEPKPMLNILACQIELKTDRKNLYNILNDARGWEREVKSILSGDNCTDIRNEETSYYAYRIFM